MAVHTITGGRTPLAAGTILAAHPKSDRAAGCPGHRVARAEAAWVIRAAAGTGGKCLPVG
ncbi:MAG: hypothetical protein LBS89_05385 [Zoogloeaceae bacterium]|nr:hypothetical protein [Zoogloeaceae bacterium]